MANNYFCFKQFTVEQANTAMKVGTDGVLLGAWARSESPKHILDIGTGTGLVALMLAQRTNAQIDALEIEYGAYLQASENIAKSPWSGRIRAIHISFQDFYKESIIQYDLVVCNPPFFQNSLKSLEAERNLARHSDSLPVSDLLTGCATLLTDSGTLALIIPYSLVENYIAEAKLYGLFLKERMDVIPCRGKEAVRSLLAFSKLSGQIQESSLVIESGGRHMYSDEYKKLTEDFYLYFK